MTAIIPFDAQLPARRSGNRIPGINKDVLGAAIATFPVLSIKGKVFTLVKGSEKKVLTREIDGEEEPVQSLTVAVARANTKYRVFYASNYTEGESDGKKPTCYSHDGVTPDSNASEPQAKKCAICPQNVWGVRDGKGFACSTKTRLAVVDPNNLNGEPFLLNVPAASRKSFAQVVDAADARDRDYNEMVMKVTFDKDAASPKLVFKPTGWLDDASYAAVRSLYDSEIVRDMVGATNPSTAAESVDESEVTAALAAHKAVATAKAAPRAEVISVDDIEEVVAKPKADKPKAEKPKKAEAATSVDDLLADMDSILGNKDD